MNIKVSLPFATGVERYESNAWYSSRNDIYDFFSGRGKEKGKDYLYLSHRAHRWTNERTAIGVYSSLRLEAEI